MIFTAKRCSQHNGALSKMALSFLRQNGALSSKTALSFLRRETAKRYLQQNGALSITALSAKRHSHSSRAKHALIPQERSRQNSTRNSDLSSKTVLSFLRSETGKM